MPRAEQQRFLQSLSDTERARLAYEWRFWARPEQLPPEGDWSVWLVLAGRGWGKTKTAAQWVIERAHSGARHIIVAGPTIEDTHVAVVEGESGILASSPPWFRPRYVRNELSWPNGAHAIILGAEKPDRFRNKQSDTFIVDELAAWRAPESWDMLAFGHRLGAGYGVVPRGLVATTPRPIKIIRDLIASPSTHVTRGTTYDNRANLAPAFFEKVVRRYEGTRLGRQELHAEILDDSPDALWQRAQIERDRVAAAPELRTVVVAVDPAGSSAEGADETGIVVAGVSADGRGYVLDDATGHYTPDGWARLVLSLAARYDADRVVAEANYGGEMVSSVVAGAARELRRTAYVRLVHASRGKAVRAEPVAALYERGRVHHVRALPALEDELCTWSPRETAAQRSPNRLDALVWAMTDLMVDADPGAILAPPRAVSTQFGAGAPRSLFQW